MRRWVLVGIIGAAICAQAHAQQRAGLLNMVIVIVNDAVITLEQVRMMTALAEDQAYRLYGNRPDILEQEIKKIRTNGIRLLVERELILHDFKKSGYALPESIIDDQIQDIVRRRYGDWLTLRRTLREEGTTLDRFKQVERERIIIEALRSRNVPRDLVVSPFKIETYYKDHADEFKMGEQVKLRMIVINQLAKDPPGMAKALATEIHTTLKGGASFAEMAAVYTDEASKRSQGGDWGWIQKNVLRAELNDIAFKLEPGKVSDVIQTSDACYIMLVEQKRAAGARPLSEVQEEIENKLLARERERLEKQYISRLEKKSMIRQF